MPNETKSRECLITLGDIKPDKAVLVVVNTSTPASVVSGSTEQSNSTEEQSNSTEEQSNSTEEQSNSTEQVGARAEVGSNQREGSSTKLSSSRNFYCIYFLEDLDTLRALKCCPKSRREGQFHYLSLKAAGDLGPALLAMDDEEIKGILKSVIIPSCKVGTFGDPSTVVEPTVVLSSAHTGQQSYVPKRLFCVSAVINLYQSRKAKLLKGCAMSEDLCAAVIEARSRGEYDITSINWGYFRVDNDTCIYGLNPEEQTELFKLFCKIYKGLRAGQSSIPPKTNFIDSISVYLPTAKKWLMVIDHISNNNESRTQDAYYIFRKHCLLPNSVAKRTEIEMEALKKAIYVKAFERSNGLALSRVDSCYFFRAKSLRKALLNETVPYVDYEQLPGGDSRRAKVERVFSS